MNDLPISEKLIEENNIDISSLKKKMKQEYQIGYNYVNEKRTKKNREYKFFMESLSNWELTAQIMSQIQDSLMSINYLDEEKIEFLWAMWLKWHQKSDLINKSAKYDYKKMDKAMYDYYKDWDKYFYGRWWFIINWWDNYNQCITLDKIDIMTVIPDPTENYLWTDRRFIWFEGVIDREDITEEDWYFNIDQIKKGKLSAKEEAELSRIDKRSLWTYSDSNAVYTYTHYMYFEKKAYMTIWANTRNLLIKVVEIEPITKEEKDNYKKIDFPVFIDCFGKPIPWDWFWPCVPDQSLETQKAISELLNLQRHLAIRNAFWEDKLVNIDKVDIDSLKNLTKEPKYIPVEWDEEEEINLSNVIVPIAKEQESRSADNFQWTLEKYLQINTGINPIVSWQIPQWQQTKAEIQTAQLNANGMFLYTSKISKQINKRFWKMRLRWTYYNVYKKNITVPRGKKIPDSYELIREDFEPSNIFDVQIETKSEISAKNQKKLATLLSIWPTLVQGNTDKMSLTTYKRELWRAAELEEEIVESLVPETNDERLAYDNLNLIINWETPSAPQVWEDHETFIKIYYLASPSKIRDKAILDRELALRASWAPTWVQPWEWNSGLQQMISAQTTSDLIAQSNQDLASNQDIQWQ